MVILWTLTIEAVQAQSDEAATADQQVTVSEGLKIFATFNGQTYTEADDALAVVFTDFLGNIPNEQGLGLQFEIADVFTVYTDTFINPNDATDAGVQSVTYTSIPEPSSILGLSVLGLGLLLAKKTLTQLTDD